MSPECFCNKMSVTQPKAVPQELVENCIKFNSIAPGNLRPLLINCPCLLQQGWSCLPRAAGAGLAEKAAAEGGDEAELSHGLESMERLGGSHPSPAATCPFGQGSRSLGRWESPARHEHASSKEAAAHTKGEPVSPLWHQIKQGGKKGSLAQFYAKGNREDFSPGTAELGISWHLPQFLHVVISTFCGTTQDQL